MRSQRHARAVVVLATALLTILTALVGVTGSASAAPRPKVKGTPATGHVLTCQVPASLTQAKGKAKAKIVWKRDAARIKTATKRTYRVKRSDEGRDLSCGVARAGKALLLSAAVEVIEAPRVTDAPSVSATGNLLTCDPGAWAHEPELAFSWTRDGSPYGGPSPTLITVLEDAGHTFVCLVAGRNASGSSGYVASAPHVLAGTTPPPATQPPVTAVPLNATRPVVTYDDGTLTCDPGLWNGDPVLSYEWDRDGSPVIDADDTSLVVGDEDAGHFFTCLVTGTNAAGSSGAAASERVQVPGPVVAPAPTTAPHNTDVPTLTLAADTLTCDPGTWEGDPALTFAWTRNGSGVADATADTLPVGTADAGATFVCLVTGTNALGSTGGVASAGVTVPAAPGPDPDPTTDPVTDPPAPTLVDAPQLAGITEPGHTLTCSTGTWTGDDLAHAYAWQRDGSPVVDATAVTYVPSVADAGHRINCLVEASAGPTASGYRTSAQVEIVMPPPPAADPAPSVSPTTGLVAGSTLTCDRGTWSGHPLGYSYAWTADGVAIADATGTSYDVTVATVGAKIACVVTATNATADTATTSNRVVADPTQLTDVAISGTATIGQSLTCLTGTWDTDPDTTFTVTWKRGATTIATGSSYELVDADAGTSLTCTVVAHRGYGATSASSTAVTPAAATTGPQVFGGVAGETASMMHDGQLHTWGYNYYVTTGNGATLGSQTAVSTPTATAGSALDGVEIVSASHSWTSSVALADDGTVYTWGANWVGQLGTGGTDNSSVPVAVPTAGTPMAGKTIVAVSAADQSILALASDGTLFGWGTNANGVLAGLPESNVKPQAIPTVGTPLEGKTIVGVATGSNHVVALTSDGEVFVWGLDYDGQVLGDGWCSTWPCTVGISALSDGGPLDHTTISSVGANTSASYAVTADGRVFAWGSDGAGQLGDGATVSNGGIVEVALGNDRVSQLAPYYYGAVALTTDGRLIGWGGNWEFELTDAFDQDAQRAPVQIPTSGTSLDGKSITHLTSGALVGYATTSDGGAYAWGYNSNGETGTGSISDYVRTPTPIALP